jgi:hypothetical protein
MTVFADYIADRYSNEVFVSVSETSQSLTAARTRRCASHLAEPARP